MELAEGRKTNIGMKRGVKMVSNLEILKALADRVQMFNKLVAWSTLGLADVKEARSGAPNTLDEVYLNLCFI